MNAASASAAPLPDSAATEAEAGGTPSQETAATPSTDGQASPDEGRGAETDGTGATAGAEGADTTPDKPLTQKEVDGLLKQVEERVEARWRARTNQGRDSELNQLRAELKAAKQEADKAILANSRAAQMARTQGVNFFDMQDVTRQASEEVDAFYAAQAQEAQRTVQQQEAAVAATRAEFEGRLVQAEKERAALHIRLSREVVRNKVDVDDLDKIIDAPEVLNDPKIQRYLKVFSKPESSPEAARDAVKDMYERAEELAALEIKRRAIEAAKTALPNPQRFDRTQAYGSASATAPQLPALGTGSDYLGRAMDAARNRL